ncbi:MAG: hypothetical protein QXZ22_00960 [Sulfolobales archaeon]
MSICPWYKDGYCTSPLLDGPSADVVNKVQCLGGRELYIQCRYYRETQEVSEGSYDVFGKPFLMVHGIDKPPDVSCEFAKVFKHEQGKYLVGCLVLKRFLGVHEVSQCSSYWKSCPYRRIGLKLGVTL